MTKKYDVKINNPFSCLNNLFVNGRGQLADNLETSRSPLAIAVREQREAEKIGFKSVEEKVFYEKKEKLFWLHVDLKAKSQQRNEVLKEGVRIPSSAGVLKTNKFRKANSLLKEIKELREKINLLTKEVGPVSDRAGRINTYAALIKRS